MTDRQRKTLYTAIGIAGLITGGCRSPRTPAPLDPNQSPAPPIVTPDVSEPLSTITPSGPPTAAAAAPQTSGKTPRAMAAAPQALAITPPAGRSLAAAAETEVTAWDKLLQGRIVAQDGHFLGNLIPDEFDPNSLFNEFGVYRSETDDRSLFNEFGPYGDDFSDLSACNAWADKPPKIYDTEGNFIAHLSANRDIPNRIDPARFRQWITRFDIANR
ncbi:MAG: hypothetical protein JW810_13835 [Sedimentisphaerales bacterium]|nr:hypothetical protein [Sedimentisphaerales bacterium]